MSCETKLYEKEVRVVLKRADRLSAQQFIHLISSCRQFVYCNQPATGSTFPVSSILALNLPASRSQPLPKLHPLLTMMRCFFVMSLPLRAGPLGYVSGPTDMCTARPLTTAEEGPTSVKKCDLSDISSISSDSDTSSSSSTADKGSVGVPTLCATPPAEFASIGASNSSAKESDAKVRKISTSPPEQTDSHENRFVTNADRLEHRGHTLRLGGLPGPAGRAHRRAAARCFYEAASWLERAAAEVESSFDPHWDELFKRANNLCGRAEDMFGRLADDSACSSSSETVAQRHKRGNKCQGRQKVMQAAESRPSAQKTHGSLSEVRLSPNGRSVEHSRGKFIPSMIHEDDKCRSRQAELLTRADNCRTLAEAALSGRASDSETAFAGSVDLQRREAAVEGEQVANEEETPLVITSSVNVRHQFRRIYGALRNATRHLGPRSNPTLRLQMVRIYLARAAELVEEMGTECGDGATEHYRRVSELRSRIKKLITAARTTLKI